MKWLLIVVATFTIQGIALGQVPDKSDIPDKYSNEEIAWAKERTEMLNDVVNLSEEQRKEIMKINLRFADKYMRMRENSTSDKKWSDYKKKAFEKRMKKYNAVLTAEQTAILKEKHEHLRDKEDAADKAVREKASK